MIRSHPILNVIVIVTVSVWGVAMLRGQDPGPPSTTRPSSEVGRLAQSKVELAQRTLGYLDQLAKSGFAADGDDLLRVTWHRRLLDARLELLTERAADIKAAEEYVAACRAEAGRAKAMYGGGAHDFRPVMELEYRLLEAESILAELKAE